MRGRYAWDRNCKSRQNANQKTRKRDHVLKGSESRTYESGGEKGRRGSLKTVGDSQVPGKKRVRIRMVWKHAIQGSENGSRGKRIINKGKKGANPSTECWRGQKKPGTPPTVGRRLPITIVKREEGWDM